MNNNISGSVKRLAIGCLHLLERRAIPDFPGSTRGSPSEIVFLNLSHGGPLRPQDKVMFPMQIPWYVWKNVIIPVVTVSKPNDDQYGSGYTPDPVSGECNDFGVEITTTLTSSPSLRVWGNIAILGNGSNDVLIAKLTQAVGKLMENQGYIPVGTITGRR